MNILKEFWGFLNLWIDLQTLFLVIGNIVFALKAVVPYEFHLLCIGIFVCSFFVEFLFLLFGFLGGFFFVFCVLFFAHPIQILVQEINAFLLVICNVLDQRPRSRGRVACIVVLTLSSLLPRVPVDGRDPFPSVLLGCVRDI